MALNGDLPATAVAWAPDGASLFVVTGSVRGSALLKLELDGTTRQLWTGKSLLAASAPVPSPDGSHMAFAGSTYQSNVWMIEDFKRQSPQILWIISGIGAPSCAHGLPEC